jgi:hypothetical protein
MPLQNKKLRRTIVREISDEEFMPNIGLGIFDFSMKEKDLVNILKEKTKYNVSRKDNTVIYEVQDKGERLLFFFHYNGRGLDYLSIHLTNITLLGMELKNKKCNRVVDIVRAFHKKHSTVFKYTYEETDEGAFIDFKNIGLSIWFESEVISDISISPS